MAKGRRVDAVLARQRGPFGLAVNERQVGGHPQLEEGLHRDVADRNQRCVAQIHLFEGPGKGHVRCGLWAFVQHPHGRFQFTVQCSGHAEGSIGPSLVKPGMAFLVNLSPSNQRGTQPRPAHRSCMLHQQHLERRQPCLDPSFIDEAALTLCFGSRHDGIGSWVRGGRAVNIAQLVNAGVHGLRFDESMEHTHTLIQGLNVWRFSVGHGVVDHVDFHVLRLAMSGFEQQAVSGVKTVKGATDQTPQKRSVAHGARSEQQPFIPSLRCGLVVQVCAPAPNGLSHR